MNGACFQDSIGFLKFSISPKFLPLLMDKDLLHKGFESLRGIKQELYAKSFQVNDMRDLLTLKTRVVNLKREAKDLSRDLQPLEVRGKLGSKTLYWLVVRTCKDVGEANKNGYMVKVCFPFTVITNRVLAKNTAKLNL